MKPFSKSEIIGVSLIFLVVGTITLSGLVTSLRRARDAQRMNDIGAISDALDVFREEYGFLPESENGKIKACKGSNFDQVSEELKALPQFDRKLFFSGLRACEWGVDRFADVADDTRKPYLSPLPRDPRSKSGRTYTYLSNTNRYQIFASLEGREEEDSYNPKVVTRNISCGDTICNVGKGFMNTPLDKSIEEYENELLQKNKVP